MIDTEALRKKIINFAIQGKLTEQLPEDGDAESLYAHIQDEKKKLIDEGKIKKQKKLPEITEEEIPFEIPNNWKWIRITDVVKKDVGGGTPSKSVQKYWDGGDIPWITVKDFSSAKSGVIDDTIDHITKDGLDNSASSMVDKKAIIICMRMALGKIVRISKPMSINQDLRAIWLHEGVDENYFVLVYSNLKIEGRGMTVNGIRKEELMNYIFPLPPLKEQNRIVVKINKIFEQIEIIDKLQTMYGNDTIVLKNKIIDAGIRGKLTEQLPEDGNAEDLFERIQEEKEKLVKEGKLKKQKKLPKITEKEITFKIPENWKWVRLGDLAEQIQYGYNSPAQENGRIRMVRISDIQNGKVQWESVPYCDIEEDSIKDYLLKKNDILFARTGGTVGKSYIVKDVPSEAVFAGYLIRTSYCSMVDSQYMKYFMESDLYWKQIRNGTIAMAQPNCNGKTLSKMLVPFPPFNEQKRIVDSINRILNVAKN